MHDTFPLLILPTSSLQQLSLLPSLTLGTSNETGHLTTPPKLLLEDPKAPQLVNVFLGDAVDKLGSFPYLIHWAIPWFSYF